jgi:hypothetical protein
MTFYTTDPPETVVTFYRDYLLVRGWKQSGQVHFDNKEACPLYSFEIVTSAVPADRTATQVELRLVPEPCSDR